MVRVVVVRRSVAAGAALAQAARGSESNQGPERVAPAAGLPRSTCGDICVSVSVAGVCSRAWEVRVDTVGSMREQRLCARGRTVYSTSSIVPKIYFSQEKKTFKFYLIYPLCTQI